MALRERTFSIACAWGCNRLLQAEEDHRAHLLAKKDCLRQAMLERPKRVATFFQIRFRILEREFP